MGFGVPIDHWLRGDLKNWAGDLLNSTRLKSEGFFIPEQIENALSDHWSEKYNRAYQLWDVLMFQTWKDDHEQRLRSR